MTGSRPTARVWAALGVLYVVWGSTYLGIELAVRTLPPLFMLFVRFAVAGALLYAWVEWREGRETRPTRRMWGSAMVVGVALLGIGNGLVAWAEHRGVETGLAALIIASLPIAFALLGRVVLHTRLERRTLVGIAIGFGGVALLVTPHGGESDVLGEVSLLFSTACWAAGSLWAQRVQIPSPLRWASMQMLCASAYLLCASALRGEWGDVHPSAVSWTSIGGLAYLILAGSILGFTAYSWLLRSSAPTSLVGTYAYVNPVVAVLLGTAFLGEPLGWRTAVGGAVVLASVVLIVTRPRPRPRTEIVAVPARGR